MRQGSNLIALEVDVVGSLDDGMTAPPGLRSIAEQSIRQLGGATSVLARQRRDHVKLDGLLQELATAGIARQRLLLLRIYRLVFPHAFAEESVLWPVIRRVVPDGEDLTLRVEQEHQEINELVLRLEMLPPESAGRQAILPRLIELLWHDVRDEEDELLPRLQAALTPAQLRRIGLAWEATRLIAPTRAHPIVSRRPPGNVLAAVPLAVLDRVRDLVDIVRYRGNPEGAVLQSVSHAAAAAAHGTELLPGMRAGEDSSTRVRTRLRPRWGIALALLTGAGTVAAFAYRRRLRAA